MPTVYLSLSTRVDARGYAQVLIRLTGGHGITPRAKSGIFVPAKFWSREKQRLSPPRLTSEDQRRALFEQRRLDELRSGILEAFADLNDRSRATSEWLAGIVSAYHNPQPAAKRKAVGFFEAFRGFRSSKLLRRLVQELRRSERRKRVEEPIRPTPLPCGKMSGVPFRRSHGAVTPCRRTPSGSL